MQDRFVREFYDEPHPFVSGFVADRPCHITLETLRKDRVMNLSPGVDNLVVTLDEETFSIHLFSRKVNETILSFEPVIPNNKPPVLMTDTQTQSTWDAYSGTAIDGPLKGKQLTQEIDTIAYTQNWSAFYPRSVELPIRDQNQK